jgi:GT2 family glycosyltransferase
MTAVRLDVLIPTFQRPQALAVTLAGLAAQTLTGFRVVVSDQSTEPAGADLVVRAVVRILEHHGTEVEWHERRPRRGLAEQRDHLLRRSSAPYVLFLDDDVWLEPWSLQTLLEAIERLGCGFVGYAVQGLSYTADVREHEQAAFELWENGVSPERVRRGEPGWDRYRLHNAANPTHLGARLGLRPGEWRAYKVAWIGACVLYRRHALLEVGGFSFCRDLPPEHAGEDVVAQLRVMDVYGGAGVLPSGAVHLELPTTVINREVECYDRVRW